MEIQLPQMHATELRVRQTMIEHEQDVHAGLAKMLLHEEEVTHQLEELLLHLLHAQMNVTHHEDFVSRQDVLRKQRKQLRKLRVRVAFVCLRIEAMHEAMSFYLVRHFDIDPSLPWTLDIDNAVLRSDAEPVAAL